MTVFSNSIRGTSRASAMSPIVSSYSPSAGKLCSTTEAAARAERHAFEVMLLPAGARRACGGSEITMLAGSP